MNTALLLVDIQNDYFKGGKMELFCPEKASKNAKLILDLFRERGLPVFHIRHISTKEGATFFLPDTEGSKIYNEVFPLPGEHIIIKHRPNSFFETDLEEKLRELKIDHVIICGMMSHMCIDTTVRAAADLGFTVTLLDDAAATRKLTWNETTVSADIVHKVMMASLNGTFAKVITAEKMIEELKDRKDVSSTF